MKAEVASTVVTKTMILLVTAALFVLSPSTAYGKDGDPPTQETKIYWIDEITADGAVIVKEYGLGPTRKVSLPEIEIWKEKLSSYHPSRVFYWDKEPDIKKMLLQNGLARLKDDGTAAPEYIEAQNEAKSQALGMWKASSAGTQPEAKPSLPARILKTLKGLNWRDIGLVAGSLLIGVTGWYGGSAFIGLIRDWRRRYQIACILLGRPSTGKSWLWHRMLYSNLSQEEFHKIDRTEATIRTRSTRSKPMGRYEVTPVYVDTPGAQPGQQLTSMMEDSVKSRRLRRFLRPSRSAWIIVLASTPDKSVTRTTEQTRKTDSAYIEQQLGHLDLPLGFLDSDRMPKPQMVIICLAKFDLFADHAPDDPSSSEVKKQLDGLFKRHISRIQNVCRRRSIPSAKVFCSAVKGWGVPDILASIEAALFGERRRKNA